MDSSPLNVLSLCAGVGGLDLALRLAVPDARTVCYVEIEAHACEVLGTRMDEGILHPAAVWSDLTTFRGGDWRGVLDLVIAGFPCQPWSAAGSRKGHADDRWLWPAIDRILGESDVDTVFLENVPGLIGTQPYITGCLHCRISSGRRSEAAFPPADDGARCEACRASLVHAARFVVEYSGLASVLRSLAQRGFDAEWGIVSAADVGAAHKRDRIFILAYRDRERLRECRTIHDDDRRDARGDKSDGSERRTRSALSALVP